MTSDPQATVRMDMAAELAALGGRYRVEGLVASGGVASVFRATDLLLDRTVAVKVLKEANGSAEDRARFVLETQTLARLSHPGLVTLLDAGMSEGQPYLVMELVDGPSMSAVLDEPLDLLRAADLGAQIATSLAYAHSQGVVHRDVKPGNVLLRSDGRVKLADFGIARLVGQRSEYTQTGVVVGSVHYLAPEQVAFEEITPAVDVYALGMLLLRAITGGHAFDGPTIETALARLSAAPEIPADLPTDWRALLTSMTARRPDERPTAARVAETLAELSTTRTTTRTVPLQVGPPTAHRTGHRHRTYAAVTAALLLVTALYGARSLVGGPGEADASDVAAAPSASKVATNPPQGVHAAGSTILPVAVAPNVSATGRHGGKATQHKPKAHHPKHHKKPKHKGKPAKGKPSKH